MVVISSLWNSGRLKPPVQGVCKIRREMSVQRYTLLLAKEC
jgi:hypothetical protein